MNDELARATLQGVARLGVREFCVCPGSRNAPWVRAIATDPGDRRAYYFFEERSAAFFALGRIRATGRPVAVLTTSGTAAAELLPATVEAHYSGLPLVLMTADRPRRFRGTGAPQTAQQVGLFGPYAGATLDVTADEHVDWPSRLEGPLHLNVCFEEPTLAAADIQSAGGELPPFASARNPVVIVGGLRSDERAPVREFLLSYGAPAYMEAQSGLRECRELDQLRLRMGDKLAQRAADTGYKIDGVLRIGTVPTHRFWRDLDDRLTHVPVCSVSWLPFPGLARQTEVLAFADASDTRDARSASFSELLARVPRVPGAGSRAEGLLRADAAAALALDEALMEEPRSEPGMVRLLSETLPEGAQLFVGNSLPVREWDLAAAWADRGLEVRATRGVNGIDGQISTFLGQCDPARDNWALIGDLTAMYDMAGPWILPQLDVARVDIVVMNNGGGRIFERMYAEREFQNPHSISFEGLAAMWGMHYLRAEAVQSAWRSPPADARSRLIELTPDQAATQRFWRRYLEAPVG